MVWRKYRSKNFNPAAVMILNIAVAPFVHAEVRPLVVTGWQGTADFFRKDRPDPWLGDDPVVGRQACPALIRFNAVAGHAEPLLLKDLPERLTAQSDQQWVFRLRPGIRWWSGAPVSVGDLADFLKREMGDLQGETASNIQVQVQGSGVMARLPKASHMSPYLLSGRPFWRPSKESITGYECAGLYRIDSLQNATVRMSLSPGYTASYSPIEVSTKPALEQNCSARVDLPIVTALIWNFASSKMSSAPLRKAITHAIPRGELMRTAGGDLGTLLSGPVLRSHPGYADHYKVRPYSVELANSILASEGFKQVAVGSPRLGKDGNVLKLLILRGDGSTNSLVEKVISDSLASLGIEVEFRSAEGARDIAKDVAKVFDGVLTGVALPWPTLNLKTVLHSYGAPSSSLAFPFFVPGDKSLDDFLDAYESSLGAGQMPAAQLAKIHGRVAEIEGWTVLMGHQACLNVKGLGLRGNIAVTDPDWFRRQILE